MITSYDSLLPFLIPKLPGCPTNIITQALRQSGRAFARETESWVERSTTYLRDADAAYDVAYAAAIAAGKTASAAVLLGDVAYDSALEYTLTSAYDAEMLRPLNVWDTGDDDDAPVDPDKYDFDPSTKVLQLDYLPDAPVATAWAALTVYATGTNVIQAGAVYECAIAHTAGVFADDLAAGKWVLLPNGLIVKMILLPSINATDLATWYMERWAEGIMARTLMTLIVLSDKPWTSPDRLDEYRAQYDQMRNRAMRDRFVEYKSMGMTLAPSRWMPI